MRVAAEPMMPNDPEDKFDGAKVRLEDIERDLRNALDAVDSLRCDLDRIRNFISKWRQELEDTANH